MYEVKRISSRNCDDYIESYYAGYTQEEIDNHVKNYQAKFYGDIIFEVLNVSGESYYLNCKMGDSYNDQVDFIISSVGIILINANANLYKFDLDTKQNLPIDAYASVLFDNTQPKQNTSPYLRSLSSEEYGLMAITDNDGAALINFEGVLWRYEEPWAYADYFRLIAFTKKRLILELDDPAEGEISTLKLDLTTGKKSRI